MARKASGWLKAAGALLMVLAAMAVQAQTVSPVDDYRRLVSAGSEVKALGTGLFGDTVDLYSGQLTVRQTDIELPGNDDLRVALTRRFTFADADDWGAGQFGDWELELPRISGIFSSSGGWTTPYTGNARYQRCSRFGAPPTMAGSGGGLFQAHEYWMGTHLEIEGGREELLGRAAAVPVPGDGHAYPVTTRSGVMLRCLDSLAATSAPGSLGEGFVARTPDGLQYFFDHMVTRPFTSLNRVDDLGSPPLIVATGGTVVTPAVAESWLLPRQVVTLYPSRVVDRYGNEVRYIWNPQIPGQLKEIRASDGRAITFTYAGSAAGVRSATDGRRIWRYTYGSGLSRVILPDSTYWTISMYGLSSLRPSHPFADCDTPGTVDRGSGSGQMTHPNGAELTLTSAGRTMGRSWVPRACWGGEHGLAYALHPRATPAAVITQRRLKGPGLPSAGYTWSYAWEDMSACWDPGSIPAPPAGTGVCSAASAGTRSVTVTRPEGWRDRYVFGTRFQHDEGLLLSVEQALDGGNAQRKEWLTYAASSAGPYPETLGYSYQSRSDGVMGTRYQPLQERLQQVGDDVFQWEALAFDQRARAVRVLRSSENASVTEQYNWHDNTPNWVIGQLAAVTDLSSGVALQETSFDGLARPSVIREMGRLLETRSYSATGQLEQQEDARGNATLYADWYRGVPRLVTYADGSQQRATVTAEGWLSAVTDALGNTTRYTFDGLGRITGITPPSSTPARASTTRSFAQRTASNGGTSQSYWSLMETQGNLRQTTWYDALLRPWREEQLDTTDATTKRVVQRSYDSTGSVTSQSLPATTESTVGSRTHRDGLGRITRIEQDSELGVLTTVQEYLAGGRVRVTDPRGNATTTTYRFLDTPSYDEPTQIDAAEGARTRILRNALGLPVRIERESY